MGHTNRRMYEKTLTVTDVQDRLTDKHLVWRVKHGTTAKGRRDRKETEKGGPAASGVCVKVRVIVGVAHLGKKSVCAHTLRFPPPPFSLFPLPRSNPFLMSSLTTTTPFYKFAKMWTKVFNARVHLSICLFVHLSVCPFVSLLSHAMSVLSTVRCPNSQSLKIPS